MRVAYFDCSTGISGDMTLAALLDTGIPEEKILQGIDSLNLPGVNLKIDSVMKGGFRCRFIQVQHPEQHAHRHLGDITKLISQANAISPSQKELARQIFLAVATAEAKVHGSTIDQVHFHEVGAIDSIVDIVGVSIGLDLLKCDQIVCSRVPTGRGQVQIDHGICTVPTPGTAELLKGIPLIDIPIEAELTTPTGAAILTTVVDRFGALPEMVIDSIGYGAGSMSFTSRANLLRIFLGTAVAHPAREQICILETNLDDVTGEVMGYCKQQLLQAGALDVFSTPIQMKKDRPGVMLSLICQPHKADELEEILFQETGTLGVRHHICDRSVRNRHQQMVETIWGPVSGKVADGVAQQVTFSPEFEDCAKVAAEHGVPLRQIYRAAITAFETQNEIEKCSHSHDHHSHDHHSHDHHNDS